MIYTLTLNPVLDLEYRVDHIRMGEIHRSSPARVDWGGKGFNVSRVLHVLGEKSIAVGFAGGYTGKRLDEGLQSNGILTDLIWVGGETRTNISIVGFHPTEYIKVNEPGPTIKPDEVDQLLDNIRDHTRPDDIWVMSGSLPPGVNSDFYARAIRLVKDLGGRVLLDTSGDALRAGCGEGPDLVKPNAEEAAEMTGLDTGSRHEAVEAALRIATGGPRRVVISMGSQGALAVEGGKRWYAHPLQIAMANPVGAGDAFVAGLTSCWVRGKGLDAMLRLGTACGASAAAQPGTGVGPPAEINAFLRAVEIEEL